MKRYKRFALTGLCVANLVAMLAMFAIDAGAQTETSDGPVLRARAVSAAVAVKVFHPSGSIRLVGWDRDSLVVRGHVPKSDHLLVGSTSEGVKIAIESAHIGGDAAPADLVIYLPRQGSVSIKCVDASIVASNVSGWFYSISGSIQLTGFASEVEAESMSGDVVLDLTVPWVKARTGRGQLLLRGAPQDVDASSVGGTIDVATPTILRGRFASVTGDIRYTGPFPRGGLYDFSDHAGAVELRLPRSTSASLDLSTVTGTIDNRFGQVRPVTSDPHTLRLRLGASEAQATIRTFKGAIRIIPQ